MDWDHDTRELPRHLAKRRQRRRFTIPEFHVPLWVQALVHAVLLPYIETQLKVDRIRARKEHRDLVHQPNSNVETQNRPRSASKKVRAS